MRKTIARQTAISSLPQQSAHMRVRKRPLTVSPAELLIGDGAPVAGPLFDLGAIATTPPKTEPRPIQRKLVVGAANDRYEQEADEAASRAIEHNEALTLQDSHIDQTSWRKQDPHAIQKKSVSQRLASGSDQPVSSGIADAIQQTRGRGASLPDALRRSMEESLGADFSQVRVHLDEQAHQLSQSLQAQAFTTGRDIFFQRGAYRPGMIEGRRLLAHELSHVMQQRGPAIAIQRKLKVAENKSGEWEVEGRPDKFKKKVDIDVQEKAEGDGEGYIIQAMDQSTGKIKLPTLHKRHKIAWDLWKSAINRALSDKNPLSHVQAIAKLARVGYLKRLDETEITNFATDVFNAEWNLWLGPGDENVSKGSQITSARKGLENAAQSTKKGEQEKAYQKYYASVFDPRDIRDFTWNDQTRRWDFRVEEDELSPDSTRAFVGAKALIAYEMPANQQARKEAQGKEQEKFYHDLLIKGVPEKPSKLNLPVMPNSPPLSQDIRERAALHTPRSQKLSSKQKDQSSSQSTITPMKALVPQTTITSTQPSIKPADQSSSQLPITPIKPSVPQTTVTSTQPSVKLVNQPSSQLPTTSIKPKTTITSTQPSVKPADQSSSQLSTTVTQLPTTPIKALASQSTTTLTQTPPKSRPLPTPPPKKDVQSQSPPIITKTAPTSINVNVSTLPSITLSAQNTSSSSSSSEEEEIDINKADIHDLKGIKGIGSTIAKAIVVEREVNGQYKGFDDLYQRLAGPLRPQTVGGLKNSLREYKVIF